jgi:acyl-CoA synthetase (AMP-forming)/AMP-acid ligase II
MSINLITFFDKGVEIDPDRACLIGEEETRSYRQAQQMSCRIAHALVRDGITPTSHVAVLSHNTTRAFECVLGLVRAGCAWVPINARNTLDETAYILNMADTDALFFAAEFAATVQELQRRCPRLKEIICIDAQASGHASSLDAWLAGVPDAFVAVEVPGDSIATLSSTGGTTGKPKGVVATHRVWAYRIAETLLRVRIDHPVNLVAAPMTHAAGAGALELMVMGATHVILPRFDPELVVNAIGERGVTHLFLPPTAIYRLLAYPGVRRGNYTSLRYFTYAAAPMSLARLKEAMEVFGPVMCQGYGGTELGTSACWSPPEEHAKALASGDDTRLASCGYPSPLARIEIVDDAGRVLPQGEAGEIVVRSYSNADGYYNNEQETRHSFIDGWFHTGDLGLKDAAGRVHITDRKKDMIKSGGFNVYPSEIEQVLTMHTSVQDCAVVGVPHADWGEAVKAVVELKPGMQATEAELEQLCRARLAGYKIPKSFEFWREIPRSPVGKVLKREIRARYWQGAGKQI